MRSTQDVVEHHLQAFGEGLDSILSDYTDQSCLMSPQGTFRGTSEIRTFFEGFVSGLPEGFMEAFKVTKMEADGEVGYITWEANPWFPLGTDTFVVKEGMIANQTFAAHAN
jgi:ketosteroid isomerase-like protein